MAAGVSLSHCADVLERPFRAIIFDWDGTAVVHRAEDATPLAERVAALLRLRVWIVVVTGTHFGHIDRQLCRHLAPSIRRYLLVCTNRGSEVYGFDRHGTVVRRWCRLATPQEEQQLTAIAEAVRDQLVARTGLEIGIVYDRLNRRKIDLIPLPEWADPPKDRIGELLQAVEARLRGAGLAGGLAEALEMTRRIAAAHGLATARITSDVKHIEVGLTDKGDAVAWIRHHLLQPRHLPLSEVLIVGDEFGPLAGFAGSDDRMRQEVPGAVVVSVGVEPNGVPVGVLHLGGGPARFRDLLVAQLLQHRQRALAAHALQSCRRALEARGWLEHALTAPEAPGWQLQARGYRPALEHEIESRFAVSNGLLGVRGSLETPTLASRPRTFVAGLYYTPRDSPVPILLWGPDWLRLQLWLDGEALRLDHEPVEGHCRTLDLQRGMLVSEWCYRDQRGRAIRLRTARWVSLANRALAVQLARIDVAEPLVIVLEARLEPPNNALDLLRAEAGLTLWGAAESPHRLAVASRVQLMLDGRPLAPTADGDVLRQRWAWLALPDQPATLWRVVAMARGETEAGPAGAARRALGRAQRGGASRLLAAHTRAWAQRWAASDVAVEGDDAAQRALRFAIYHLISAANPQDDRVSIGARALTGDAYLGHVFWDTEIFLVPFYTLTWPAAARALLMYRYHTLPGARAKAARLGFRGALYAWESTDTGEEATPPYVIGPEGEVIPIRCGTEEQHISADIAYAVWQYWSATQDTRFLLDAGAEIILETARFWASRAAREADGRYHIRGVIGPDEYHEGVDDNAYTNVLAQWNLERGVEVAALLQARWPAHWAALAARLELGAAELEAWRAIAAAMYTGFDPVTGLFEQFRGYFGLEPIDLAAYEPRTAPMDVLLGRERTQRSQVIKQADVVMLLMLLWERFPAHVRAANFRYYEPRCGHGSSLSPPVHAVVAARLGHVTLAERYFRQAAAIDLDDTMGNASGGVHIAALGGLWQAAVFGFAGLSLRADGLRLAPQLPATWEALRFRVQWRGRQVQCVIRQEPPQLTAILERGAPLRLYLGTQVQVLRRGQPWTADWTAMARRSTRDEHDGAA